MAHVQNEKLQKDRVEPSALGHLFERQKDLFTLLAARNWSDTDPGLSTQTTRLLGSRNPERQWNLLEDWSCRWPGNISKQGAIQFLSSGYTSRVLPGLLFCYLQQKAKSSLRNGTYPRTTTRSPYSAPISLGAGRAAGDSDSSPHLPWGRPCRQ
jgi:hypothetical protein